MTSSQLANGSELEPGWDTHSFTYDGPVGLILCTTSDGERFTIHAEAPAVREIEVAVVTGRPLSRLQFRWLNRAINRPRSVRRGWPEDWKEGDEQ